MKYDVGWPTHNTQSSHPVLHSWKCDPSNPNNSPPNSFHSAQEMTFPTHTPAAEVCLCVCFLTHGHLSLSDVCVCVCVSAKWVFTVCDRRGEGHGEVLSGNTVSDVSYYTQGKKRGADEVETFFSPAAFKLEFMEAAVVENEDLLCGLRSPDSTIVRR